MGVRSNIVAAVVAVLLCGLAAIAAPAPALGRSVTCPDQPLTVGDLLRLWGDGGGSAGFGGATNPRAHQCYGRSEIRIRGFVNRPDGLGGTNTYVIHPRWLAENGGLILFGSTREVAPGYGAGRYYGISIPPRFGRVERRYQRSWVDVTAHFDDPAARTCHATGLKEARPTRREAVAACRDVLVLSSIQRASGPLPDTAVSAFEGSSSHVSWSNDWLVLLAAGFVGACLVSRRTGRVSARMRSSRPMPAGRGSDQPDA